MVKKNMKGGAEPLTKMEVLDKYPKVAAALEEFAAERKAGGGKMTGSGWWDDFVNWLKDNKVISTVSKIGSIIAGAVGALPLSTALGAVSTGSAAFGYGKKKGGMYSYADAQAIARGIARPAMRRKVGGKVSKMKKGFTANDMAQHINAVAGISGAGTMVQNHSSQAMRTLGTGTMPSHLQPFLTSRKIKGSGVSQAVGSIGNAGRIKF